MLMCFFIPFIPKAQAVTSIAMVCSFVIAVFIFDREKLKTPFFSNALRLLALFFLITIFLSVFTNGIINDLSEVMNNRKLFNDKDELESSMFNYLKMSKNQQTSELDHELNESDFSDEFLKVDYKDYYFSNVIARSSKTMLECNNAKIDLKKTGTEG